MKVCGIVILVKMLKKIYFVIELEVEISPRNNGRYRLNEDSVDKLHAKMSTADTKRPYGKKIFGLSYKILENSIVSS